MNATQAPTMDTNISFSAVLKKINLSCIKDAIYTVSARDVQNTLNKTHHTIADFTTLIAPAAAPFLESMAAASRRITLSRFGKAVRLYAPLYISNECCNACAYCGFNVRNEIKRVTLGTEEVLAEAVALYAQGFRHLLLVSGEAPARVPVAYLEALAQELCRTCAAVAVEVYPLDEDDYRRLTHRGVTGIAVYQETYDRSLYASLHSGPKADFDYRLATPERAGRAGFRELGIGALLGLSDFRVDLTCVALHAAYLMKKFWKARVALSFPRLRHAAGLFIPPVPVSDRELAQAIFALRMVLPDADLVLSTREGASFRNGMAGIGITRMSAGSKTRPGGYALARDSLEQFDVADTRLPAEVAVMLEGKGLEPVWKDFDRSFLFDTQNDC